MTRSPRSWHLRPATMADVDAVHRLLCVPEVFRYLADDEAPPRAAVEAWITKSQTDFAHLGIGLWLLEARSELGGCVRLEINGVDEGSRSAEITYVLHPEHWGQGLATRMSWTAIKQAFSGERIRRVVAGADLPNRASFAVMRRLGMRFHRRVQYPAGPGEEYELDRDLATKLEEVPEPIPLES